MSDQELRDCPPKNVVPDLRLEWSAQAGNSFSVSHLISQREFWRGAAQLHGSVCILPGRLHLIHRLFHLQRHKMKVSVVNCASIPCQMQSCTAGDVGRHYHNIRTPVRHFRSPSMCDNLDVGSRIRDHCSPPAWSPPTLCRTVCEREALSLYR